MVILLCQTPRRGVVAVVNYAPTPLIRGAEAQYRKKEASSHCRLDSVDETMTATPTNGRTCFPFAVNCRFDKTFFGVPKKCGYCQKMVYGTGFACQHCRFRCHKRCVMLSSNSQPYLRQKVCSLSRIPIEDDSVVKELISKCEINCNSYDDDVVFRERKTSGPDLYNAYGSYPNSPPLSVASGGSNVHSSLETINEQHLASPVLRDCSDTTTPNYVRRFLNFLPWNTKQEPERKKCDTSSTSSSRRSSVARVPSELKPCALSPTPSSLMLNPLDLSSRSSNVGANSSCSPQVRTPVDEFNSFVLDELFKQQKTRQQLQRKLNWVKHIVGERGAYSQDCVIGDRAPELRKSRSPVPERNSGQRGSPTPNDKDKLVASWPLSGLHMNLDYDDSTQQLCDDESCCGAEADDEELRKRDSRVSELGEWTIPYSDLEFEDCVLETRMMKIFKGRWHGDVMIHSYNLGENNNLISTFLDDVRTFTKIRHENVALFMGASIEAPLLAVVTSVRKGETLYDAIYMKQKRIPQHTKVAVARQIAQGMGYLHAKGIVLKTFTTKNVYLECKVKISMVDSSGPLKEHDRSGKGCVRRGHLTYWSPELMRTLHVTPPSLTVDVTKATKESDVYAFGTVLYEMFAGDFPFAQVPNESIIWQIGVGMKQSLAEVSCSTSLKSLIDVCWSYEPSNRPLFMSILKELQQTAALQRRHSSSMPENLNKTGTPRLYASY